MSRVRYPRSRFTRALGKICVALETQPIRDVSHKDYFDRPQTTRVQIRTLWVVGSYARGALECGDLDVVMDAVGLNRGLPYIKNVARGFFGMTPRVFFYGGTPEKNSSGVAFQDAKLIWSSSQPDWRNAIASIAEDNGAGHFERPSDHLPLTPEQMRGNINNVEDLLRSRNEGLLGWYHIDFADDHRSQPEVPEQFAEAFSRFTDLGKATRHALAHFLAASNGHSWASDDLSRDWRGRTEFRLGGTDIYVGTPPMPSQPLENASTSRLALVPHLTARGPNRAWIIERGATHPLVKKADSRVAYALAYSDCLIKMFTPVSDWKWVNTLELFTSRAVAKAMATEMDEADDEVASGEAEPMHVIELSGTLLLESIARIERLEIVVDASGNREIFDMGKFDRYDVDHHALFDKLITLLPKREDE